MSRSALIDALARDPFRHRGEPPALLGLISLAYAHGRFALNALARVEEAEAAEDSLVGFVTAMEERARALVETIDELRR